MKKTKISVLLLLVFILAISVLAGCENQEKQTVYQLYFGLNDKDTGTQLIDTDEAAVKIQKIITDKGYGFTEFGAFGAYTENGKVCSNSTLVYYLFYVEAEDVQAIVDTAKQELNLASVLIAETDDFKYYLK